MVWRYFAEPYKNALKSLNQSQYFSSNEFDFDIEKEVKNKIDNFISFYYQFLVLFTVSIFYNV